MTAQLDLFAPAIERVTVEPTRGVMLRGAGAAEVPTHTHVPQPRPRAMHTDEEWLYVLQIAEDNIRWKSWTQPHPLPLDERPHDCIGGGGGPNRMSFEYGSKGVAVGGFGEWRYATWAVILRGLREQREVEPHIADARDLAHAYHAFEQYDRFYVRDGGSVVGGGDRDKWREEVAVPHLAKLQQIIVDLGGDPTLVVAE